MNIGFYSASSGLKSTQTALDVVSNNIANVSTNGYKDIRASFSDLIYTAQNSQNEDAQTGHGVKLDRTDLMFAKGQLMMTNRELDFALPENGFFAVADSTGEISYTRNGAFYLSQNGNAMELVNGDGRKVMGYDNQPITISYDTFGDIDLEALINNIGVFDFANPYGLTASGNDTYSQNEASGTAVADLNADKLSGVLELSTVDLAEQMVKVIQYQRAFQLNSKMVQTSDELQAIVNNLR